MAVRRARIRLMLLALVVFLPFQLSGQEPSANAVGGTERGSWNVPETLVAPGVRGQTDIYWIAADAVDATGRFPELSRELLQNIGTRRYRFDQAECSTIALSDSTVTYSLQERVAKASWVSRVVVVGRRGGFYKDIPGTLLRLDTVEDLKGQAPSFARFFFVPSGRLSVAGKMFCVEGRGYAPLAEEGEELVLFLDAPLHEEQSVFNIDPSQLVLLESETGEAVLPETIRHEKRRIEAEEFLARLRRGGAE